MSPRPLIKFSVAVALIGVSLSASRAEKKVCLIAIDIGHSESAQGAVSSRGVGEFVFNRNIANLLLEKIRKDGVAEAFIIGGNAMSLQQRTESARLWHANFESYELLQTLSAAINDRSAMKHLEKLPDWKTIS